MNKEQINELFNYALNKNLKEMFILAGMEDEYTDEPNDKLIKEMLNEIMKKIEQGDYEYFLSKINDDNSVIREICIEIFQYSSKTEDKKHIINNWKDYVIKKLALIILIQSVNDPEFTKECVLEKKEELELDSEDLKELIQSVNDSEFTKECILEKREELEFNAWNLIELIQSVNDPEFTKECILEKREELELDSGDLTELIPSVNDPEFTKECVLERREELEIDSENLTILIQSINDPEFTKECVLERREELRLNDRNLIILIQSIHNPEFTKECVLGKLGLNNIILTILIQRIHDPEFTKECVLEKREELGFNSGSLIELIQSINDPEFTKKCVLGKLELNSRDLKELIQSIHDSEFTKKYVLEKREELEVCGWDLIELIQSVNDPEFTKKCILGKLGLDREILIKLIQSIHDPEFTKKCVLEKLGLNREDLIYLIQSIDETESTLDILRRCNDVELSKEYRRTAGTIKEIYDNLDFYLEAEGRTGDKDTILRMYQKNSDILKCDFEILDYIKQFGEDKINLISCYRDITDKIIGLSELKIMILVNCISYYEKQYKTEEWTPLAETILNNINSIDENLLQQILQQSNKNEINMENLIHLLINSNNMQITTIEEFNNYEEMKKQKTNELIESGIADKCKNAVLEKAFNHGLDIAQDLLNKYGKDINNIEDESLKKYITALKEIVNLDDINILREVYKSIEPSKIATPNIFAIEKLLKIEYAKLYNKELFKVEDAIRNEELGENVYEAGTDFSMIITSIRACLGGDEAPENYYKDWNRPALANQHFCCSYIRNDMMGTAPIPFVCLGFESMKEDALGRSGNEDIYSNWNAFVLETSVDERYYSPNSQIDSTIGYNEMDYYRIQDGKKKQPDYIVVFKTNGQINSQNWQYAKQAQRDFGGKLPIIIVDVDKCLECEENKVHIMIADYRVNPTRELLNKIKQKIKNNNLTCTNAPFNYGGYFCGDVNLEELEKLLKDLSIMARMKIGSLEDIEAIIKHAQGKSNFYNEFYKNNGISKQVTLKDIINEAEIDKLGTLLDRVSEVQTQNKFTLPVYEVQHVKNVLLLSNFIGKRDGLKKEYISILQEAAIFHDVMHEKTGDPNHAKKRANWYYKNVNRNKEVAFLIAAHEAKASDIDKLISGIFKQGIDPEKKAQLIKCAQILQDAARLDTLRDNIENPEGQGFNANILNNTQNASLIEAVIELNTRQAVNSGYLHIEDDRVCKNSVTADRLVTDKDLQECYKITTPEEREFVARILSQRINQIALTQDSSEIQ